MRLGLTLFALLFVFVGHAKDEFGDLATAKSQHPDFFKPGSVLETSLNGAPWYVYCGDAERCFKDEAEAELYQEAEVQAKENFWKFFAKGDKSTKVTASGARRMYQMAEGAMRYVVMGVPKSAVKVVKEAPPKVPVSAPQKNVAAGETKPTQTMPVASQSVASNQKKPVVGVDRPVQPRPTESNQQVKQDAPARVEKTASPEPKASVKPAADEVLDDDEKLKILRARLEKKPLDFRCRIRMARIFNAQGNERRALRNYIDAARLIVIDEYTPNEEKVDDLLEVAAYAEAFGAGGLALKYYRVLQRMRVPKHAAIATSRISRLLLHFD